MTVAEARRMWSNKILWINFPSSVHLNKEVSIEKMTKRILKEATPGDKFLIGITEDVPSDKWQKSFYTIMKTINKFGELPIE